MLGFDWNNDGTDDLFDDAITLDLLGDDDAEDRERSDDGFDEEEDEDEEDDPDPDPEPVAEPEPEILTPMEEKTMNFKDCAGGKKAFAGHELAASVLFSEKTEYTDGGKGCTIMCAIENRSGGSAEVEVREVYVVGKSGEQRKKDFYLSGFLFDEGKILADAHRTRGDIFIDAKNEKLATGWKYFIGFDDKTNRKRYEVTFICSDVTKALWAVDSCRITDIQGRNACALTERLRGEIYQDDDLEARYGVKISNISIVADEDGAGVTVLYDMKERDKSIDWGEATKVKCNATLYGGDGSIAIANNDEFIYPFRGFVTASIHLDVDVDEICGVMVFPEGMQIM